MKLYKMVFFTTTAMGTLTVASAYSWFTMWMGLEINLLSIIPLFNSPKNIFSSESSLKYFITQAMASLVLLMSVILLLSIQEFTLPQVNSNLLMVMNTALLTKIGAAPFHFWLPEVMEGLNWLNCMILLTWQKIAPMIMLMNNFMNKNFFMIIITMSLVISTIMSFNQISLRKILAFSSINHIAWMLSTMMISHSIWMIYLLIYSFINLNIIMIFKNAKSFYINQINNLMNKNKTLKFSFMMNFLSLGGLPPFIGFLPKWLTINMMIKENLYLASFIMIMATLIMLFVYIRTMMTSILLSHNEPKTPDIKQYNPMLTLMNLISIPSLLICTLLFNFL